MSDSDNLRLAVKLDASTSERLQQLARSRTQSAAEVVQEAVRHYLEWLDGLPAGDRGAVEAWAEYKENGLHLTGAEVDAWLAQLEAGNDVEPPECHT
jgi:predicted transcriptional regulator